MGLSEVPLLTNKEYSSPSAFLPVNLLREARRQKSVSEGQVPAICVLDPDGDLVRYLEASGCVSLCKSWPCYHTNLHEFDHEGYHMGIIGGAVGGSFAVLLAEQLFVSGCQLLISITSAGQITRRCQPPYFVLIESALRDEGTSYHYLPPSRYAHLHQSLAKMLVSALNTFFPHVETGRVWTTDAPYRETESAIEAAYNESILAVEMEAASLYAFAEAKKKAVVCFAHVTNQMGRIQGDFEKGEDNGCGDSLRLIHRVACAWSEAFAA